MGRDPWVRRTRGSQMTTGLLGREKKKRRGKRREERKKEKKKERKKERERERERERKKESKKERKMLQEGCWGNRKGRRGRTKKGMKKES